MCQYVLLTTMLMEKKQKVVGPQKE